MHLQKEGCDVWCRKKLVTMISILKSLSNQGSNLQNVFEFFSTMVPPVLFVWTRKDLAILLRALARWQKCKIFYLLRLLYVCFAALTISFFYVRIALLVAAAASRNELSLIWGLIVVLLGNNGHRLHTYLVLVDKSQGKIIMFLWKPATHPCKIIKWMNSNLRGI